MTQLDFSSPGSPIFKLKESVTPKEMGQVMPKNLLAYVLCEYTDPSKRVFYLLRPLSSNYPAFFVLRDYTELAKEYDSPCSIQKIVH